MRLYDDQPFSSVSRAKQLRRDAPEPERRLLRGLREAFGELKWRHQVPFGPYHTDILCFSKQLVIEVDGDTHAGTVIKDEARTAFINRAGYRVLRFGNHDVMSDLEGVLTAIAATLTNKGSAA